MNSSGLFGVSSCCLMKGDIRQENPIKDEMDAYNA